MWGWAELLPVDRSKRQQGHDENALEAFSRGSWLLRSTDLI